LNILLRFFATIEIDRKIDKQRFFYSKLVFRNGLFAGYILIGEPAKAFNKLQSLINTGVNAATINNMLYN